MEAHVNDAVEEAVARGENPEEARRNAVVSLGSPKKALREYVKSRASLDVELTLARLKRSPFFGDHTQSNVWMRIFSSDVITVILAVVSWPLTLLDPTYLFFSLPATITLFHLILCYRRWFSKWIECDKINLVYLHVWISLIFRLFTGVGLSAVIMSPGVLWVLIPVCMLFGFPVAMNLKRIPADLKWSDINLNKPDKWGNA